MLYQTVHGHPIVEGFVARRPSEATVFLDAHPLLSGLYRAQEMDPQLKDVSRQLRALSAAGFRYIIIHKQLTDDEHVSRWRRWLSTTPYFEGEDLIVYLTEPQYGRDFEFASEHYDGIGIIGSAVSASVLSPGDWLECEVAWGTRTAPQQDWLAGLALVSSSRTVVQTTEFELAHGWPTPEWGRDAVARGSVGLRVDPYVEGGTFTLTVQLLDAGTRVPAGESASLGQVTILVPPRVFALPRPEHQTEATFGDHLRLLGYDLEREGETLQLTLHWQALQRMDVSYKVFVHIIELESGELATQTDVVPRDWTYPTTRWERDEVVTDVITVGLADVPDGSYALVVGVYDPDSGVRLAADGGPETGTSPDHLRLGEVIER